MADPSSRGSQLSEANPSEVAAHPSDVDKDKKKEEQEEEHEEEEEKKKCKIFLPPPPKVSDLGQKSVLIKVGNLHLRHANSCNIRLSVVYPPIVPPTPANGHVPGHHRQYPRRITKDFDFGQYTFTMNESCWQTIAKDKHNIVHRMQAKFSIQVDGRTYKLSTQSDALGQLYVSMDPLRYGSEWALHAVAGNKFIMENIQFKGYCLALNRAGLCLERLSTQDWELKEKGIYRQNLVVTITEIPDFAVITPGAIVN